MGDQTQAYDIFQTPLSSGYPLPLRIVLSTQNVWKVESLDRLYKAHEPNYFLNFKYMLNVVTLPLSRGSRVQTHSSVSPASFKKISVIINFEPLKRKESTLERFSFNFSVHSYCRWHNIRHSLSQCYNYAQRQAQWFSNTKTNLQYAVHQNKKGFVEKLSCSNYI